MFRFSIYHVLLYRPVFPKWQLEFYVLSKWHSKILFDMGPGWQYGLLICFGEFSVNDVRLWVARVQSLQLPIQGNVYCLLFVCISLEEAWELNVQINLLEHSLWGCSVQFSKLPKRLLELASTWKMSLFTQVKLLNLAVNSLHIHQFHNHAQ